MWALTTRTQRRESQEIRPLSPSGTAHLSQNHCALQNEGSRIIPCPAVLLEALSVPAPNRLGAVRVRHERSLLARKAGHSEWQLLRGSRVIWQGANVPG